MGCHELLSGAHTSSKVELLKENNAEDIPVGGDISDETILEREGHRETYPKISNEELIILKATLTHFNGQRKRHGTDPVQKIISYRSFD